MTFGAIALHAARRAGESGTGIALQSLVDRQSEFAVGGCRDRSRQVVGHSCMITGFVPRLAGYPQTARAGVIRSWPTATLCWDLIRPSKVDTRWPFMSD